MNLSVKVSKSAKSAALGVIRMSGLKKYAIPNPCSRGIVTAV
ncbi:hypothetical protein SBF1_190040 [Candidatus Desulfosporosinus infrequens]|uniref:Uncharacterized protein n=1 Tax=Candidatus Desulfosporosinus infrequens TaxID=2043169 RepID=A0A2U3KEN2_9FIRM|nr:hypothetical protein SBF1_190040 [Candidatus Desulfosporosinus infrequens]